MCRSILTFILTLNIYYANSANILGLFPHVGKSHHMVFEPLLLKLAERGHNVTVTSFFPAKNPPANYREISFQGMAALQLESFDLNIFEQSNFLNIVPRLGKMVRQVLQLSPFATLSLHMCDQLVNYKPLLDALKSDYDVVLLENFTSDCMLGLLYALNVRAPVVSLLSGTPMPWSSERVGAEDNPSYVPLITAPFSSKMSFIDRVENTILNLAFKQWFYKNIQLKERAIIEKKFGEMPDLHELGRNVSLLITNSYYTLNGVKPLVPGMVEVGGMHLDQKSKSIPKFIEQFLNESHDGVILFSFGSHIKTTTLPRYKEDIFVNSLSKLKQRVIWKFEDSEDEGTLTGNILRVKWLPQYELLKHEKVIAFICHGGMLGMTEAIAAGKPMVVVPFFGDQPSNAAAANEAGVGVTVSYAHLTENVLDNALQKVLGLEMLKQTKRVSEIWHDRETKPMDKAVFWTEHVIRWGPSTRLHATARELSFYQLNLLDVAAFIIIITLAIIISIAYLIIKIIYILRKSTKEKLL